MEEKIYKPPRCEDCPAFHKKDRRCGCQPQVRGRGSPKPEKNPNLYEMWKTCPLDWDEPEKIKKS